jgi:hypothetical protein
MKKIRLKAEKMFPGCLTFNLFASVFLAMAGYGSMSVTIYYLGLTWVGFVIISFVIWVFASFSKKFLTILQIFQKINVVCSLLVLVGIALVFFLSLVYNKQ